MLNFGTGREVGIAVQSSSRRQASIRPQRFRCGDSQNLPPGAFQYGRNAWTVKRNLIYCLLEEQTLSKSKILWQLEAPFEFPQQDNA